MRFIEKFSRSTVFLMLISIVTLVIWVEHLEYIGVPVVLLIMLFFFLFSKDTMPTVPLLFNALFMVSTLPTSFSNVPLYLYLTPVILIVGMVLHVIIYKVHLLRGKMVFGIVLMFFAMVLSSMNVAHLDFYYFFYASIGILYALFYMFYRNTIEGDHTKYLLRMMFILGMLISAQIVIYYLGVEDVRYALEHKLFNLGWGISNYVATYLIMFVSVTFYYAKKSKVGILFFLLAFTEIGLIAFTGSRGGMVAIVILLPVLIFLLFWKSNKKWIHFLSLTLVTILFVSLIFIYYDFVESVFFRFEDLMFDDTGRFEIYIDAAKTFIKYPIFGGGLFARTGTRDFNMFHNTILHTAATLGTIGLLSLIIQLWQQFKIVIRGFSSEALFIGASLLGAHLHGMVDNVYFMPQFMLLMLLMVSVREKAYVEVEPVSFRKVRKM